jgi:hypothetical protein
VRYTNKKAAPQRRDAASEPVRASELTINTLM